MPDPHPARPEPSMTDVAVFETFAEAEDAGAVRRGPGLVFAGRRVVTCNQSPAALDGLRVTSFIVSHRALLHPNWVKLHATFRVHMTLPRRSS